MSGSNYSARFFETNEWILRVGGIWLPAKTNPKSTRIITYIYNTLVIFYTQLLYCSSEILIIDVTVSDLNLLVTHLGMLSTHLLGNAKTLLMYWKFDQISKILNTLSDCRYIYESHGNFQPAVIFNDAKKLSKWLAIVFFCMTSGISILSFVPALYTLNTIEVFPGEGKSCLDYMSFLCKPPFRAESRSECEWALVYQNIGVLIYAFQISGKF